MDIRILSKRAAGLAAFALLLAACGAPSATAQSGGVFDLTWHKVAGGGATTSSGGSYTLGGTFGQTDVGIASAGVYRLDGGFWLGVAASQLADVPGPPAPPRGVLSLRGFTSSPASLERLEVAFSLASDEPAVLELLDVSGRRLSAAEVGGLGAGPHTYALPQPPGMAPGVYWVRLRQSGRVRVAKAVVLR